MANNIVEIVAKFINEASPGLKQVSQDVDGVGKSADGTKTSTDGMGFSLESLAGKLATTVSIGALAVKGFELLKASIDAYGESELVAAQVNAVLQSTNEIAGVTAEEIDNIADSLSKMSGADDEAIKRGEALLLTFTRIGSDVFPQATEAALNMSMAMGTDLQSSIIQVGKALNEPIEGVSALRRVGVQLTDQQEEQIRKFVEVNDIVSAQKIILGELETQFGGVAAMMGDTMIGSANKLKVAWGNLLETLGESSAGNVKYFNESLTETVVNIDKNIGAAHDYYEVLARVSEATGYTTRELRKMNDEEVAVYTRGVLMTDFYRAQAEAADNLAASIDGVSNAQADGIEVSNEYVPQFDKLLSISTRLGDETERYNEKQTDLLAKQAEVKAQIDELIALGWSPLSDKVRDLQGDYDELGMKYQENADKHNEAMGRIQYDLLITKLSVDGLTDAEYQVAQQAGLMFGVFDQESVDAARNMDLVAQAVTDGKLKVEDMQRALDMLNKGYEFDVVMNVIANMANVNSFMAQTPEQIMQNYGYAGGGIATGPDSGHWELLHGTEAVIPLQNGAIPVQMSGAGGGGNVTNVYLTIAPQGVTVLDETMTADMLKPYVVQAVNQAMAEGLLV